MTRWIYRVDFAGLDAAGAETWFAYATEGYITSSAHPDWVNWTFSAQLAQPLLLRRDLYGQGRTHGDVQIAHGTVILNNSDGSLDSLLSYGFDSQKVQVFRIDPDNLDTDIEEFSGVMEQLVLDGNTVTILVRDKTYMLDQALQPTKYAGTNVLPAGLEGTANDIKGQPKPICLGTVFNIDPVLVNTSRLIYQFHDQALNSLTTTVYDKRSPLTFGRTISLAELQAGATIATVSSVTTGGSPDKVTCTAAHGFSSGDLVHVASTGSVPAPLVSTQYYYVHAPNTLDLVFYTSQADALIGHPLNWINLTSAGSGTITVAKNRTIQGGYDRCNSSGAYVRLGSEPTGRITMDATALPVGCASSVWDEVSFEVLARVTAFSGSFQNHITAASAAVDVGYYWKEEMTVYEAIREVMTDVNGSVNVYANQLSQVLVYVIRQRLEAPAAPAVLELGDSNIITGSLRRVQGGDRERGIPPWRVNVNYQRNRTVMSAADLSGVALSELAFAEREYRTVNDDNAAIQLKYPASPELTVDTTINTSAQAAGHASYLSDLLSTDRGTYLVETSLSEVQALTRSSPVNVKGLLLADVVRVTYPRFGLDAGKYLAVLGYTLDLKAGVAQLTLWG